MGRKVVCSEVTVEYTCNFRGCGHKARFTALTEEKADKIAKEISPIRGGWKNISSGSSWSERVDWCGDHFHTCPTCKGVKPEWEECDCCCEASCTHNQKCSTCHGNGYVKDKEPKE